MGLVLTDIQEVGLSITPINAAGNPAPIDGTPAWGVSDPTLATVAVSADGLSVVVSTTGKLGSFQVNVSADADMGTGVKPIAGTLDVQVIASEATSVGIVAGVPTDKVVAAP